MQGRDRLRVCRGVVRTSGKACSSVFRALAPTMAPLLQSPRPVNRVHARRLVPPAALTKRPLLGTLIFRYSLQSGSADHFFCDVLVLRSSVQVPVSQSRFREGFRRHPRQGL